MVVMDLISCKEQIIRFDPHITVKYHYLVKLVMEANYHREWDFWNRIYKVLDLRYVLKGNCYKDKDFRNCLNKVVHQ
jgi:hypothetical protein